MAESQNEMLTEVADIATEAFEVFCEDLAGMFDADMGCIRRTTRTESLKNLKNSFKHLTAVCSFKAQGAINGNFHAVFDQEGLFTLAGLLLSMPEKDVLAKRAHASEADADEMRDAIAEAGNILAASWDRTCRGDSEAQTHFAQSSTLVGNPWPQLEKSAFLSKDEQLLVITCEMTIDPYPPFECAVIFPSTLVANPNWCQAPPTAPQEEKTDADTKLQTPPTQPDRQPETAQEPQPAQAQQQNDPVPADLTIEPQPEAEEEPPLDEPQTNPDPKTLPAEPKPTAEQESAQAQQQNDPVPADLTIEPQPEEEKEPSLDEPQTNPDPKTLSPEPKPPAEQEPAQAQPQTNPDPANLTTEPKPKPTQESLQDNPQNASEPANPTPEPQTGPVSDAIKKMTASQPPQMIVDPHAAQIHEENTYLPLSASARDIMRSDVVWADPEETVEALLNKMQQHNTSHVIIGQNGKPEGIISRSDIAAAMSPYLRPTFGKWRRPLDDATLRIKVKWIMSDPVTTITHDTPLTAVMDQMRQQHRRAFPVVDAQGTIVGMVTAFEIFAGLLKPQSAL